uniref:Uncharacterized protein n=1 Tax=Rhizophora mucronata TaxID=61149 RepID=A0A2P2PYV7_RHIMU
MPASWLEAHTHPVLNLCARPLLQLPEQFVPSSVQLKSLISLESLVAHLADIPIRCH